MPVRSLVNFVRTLKKFPRDKNCEYYYRGHSDHEFSILPSVYRDNYIANEDKIFKEIILRTPQEFSNENTTIEKLVKMQHYGLPTRLLDITSNPLIALFFACGKSNGNDGEVMIFKIPKKEVKYYDSDTVTILANLSKQPFSFDISKCNKSDIDEFNDRDPIPYLLHEIRDEKPQFLSIINPSDLNRVLAVKVKHNNSRISKQSGAFLLFGINEQKKIPASIPESWFLNKTFSKFDFRISNDEKHKILKDLDAMAINGSTIFPELDRQAEYVKSMFT